jgi:hypothetical protein
MRGVSAIDDLDRNPRTVRQLPLASYRRPVRRPAWRTELIALGLAVAGAAGVLYWLRLPH